MSLRRVESGVYRAPNGLLVVRTGNKPLYGAYETSWRVVTDEGPNVPLSKCRVYEVFSTFAEARAYALSADS